MIELGPWAAGDLRLLHRLLGDPAMTEHLGGPEPPYKIDRRHLRYLALEEGEMLVILAGEEGTPAGSVGWWPREWAGEATLEMGWLVLPEFQGRGIATAAVRACVDRVRSRGETRSIHAFPAPDNVPSNRVCASAGFELLGEVDFEYPKGSWTRSNDWVLRGS